jgi:hypothetical protein
MSRKTFAIFVIAACVILCLFPACKTQEQGQSSINPKSQETILRGMVKIYGNEPHTWVGIETVPEGNIYAVSPPEKAAELRKMQGRLLEFTVTIQSSRLPGLSGTATVLSWR